MVSLLRIKRFFAELTIYALSQKSGIDPGRISLLERGFKVPRDDEKERIAKALNCDVEDIFIGKES